MDDAVSVASAQEKAIGILGLVNAAQNAGIRGPYRIVAPASDDDQCDPNPNSVAIMRSIDAMPPAYRKLVHEFGYAIVRDMQDYTTSPVNMLHTLQGWRARRQDEWLNTQFVRPRRFRF